MKDLNHWGPLVVSASAKVLRPEDASGETQGGRGTGTERIKGGKASLVGLYRAFQ